MFRSLNMAETEWEPPPREEVIEKEQQIENIKSEEDGNAFLTELLQMASMNEDVKMSNISETSDMILKDLGRVRRIWAHLDQA